MILGLTGLIGAGKSEVARAWAGLGARIINADEIGRRAVENDSRVLIRLVNAFGKDILKKDNSLDRRKLGRMAFQTEENTEKLNNIVHPALLRILDKEITSTRKKNENAVIDAALLIYWNYHKRVDYTVLVTSYERLRFSRLAVRGLSYKEIAQRTKSQLPLRALRAASDFIITNNKDLETLHYKAEKLYHSLAEIG